MKLILFCTAIFCIIFLSGVTAKFRIDSAGNYNDYGSWYQISDYGTWKQWQCSESGHICHMWDWKTEWALGAVNEPETEIGPGPNSLYFDWDPILNEATGEYE